MGVAGLAHPFALPPAVDKWHVTFDLTGGLAGFDRRLELADTGAFTAMDRKRGIQTMSMATPKELAEIVSFLPDLKSAPPARETKCRDCIEYGLAAQIGSQSMLLRFNDLALPGSKAENIINSLTRLLNRALTTQPPEH